MHRYIKITTSDCYTKYTVSGGNLPPSVATYYIIYLRWVKCAKLLIDQKLTPIKSCSEYRAQCMDSVCLQSTLPLGKIQFSYAAILQQWLNVLIAASVWVVALDTADAVAVLPGTAGFTMLRNE